MLTLCIVALAKKRGKGMSVLKAKGIVLKTTEFGEANRMLTIFAKGRGIIRAAVYGAKSIKSGKGAACQVLSYSEFELSRSSGDIYTVSAVAPLETFYSLSEDIVKFSLAAYLAELTTVAVGAENPEDSVLALLLNTLYALCHNGLEAEKAKCVYELRLMSILGYRPQLTKCVGCGSIKEIVSFSARDGGLMCRACGGRGVMIGKSTADALKYIISAEEKKIFSFTVSEEVLKRAGKITEEYVKEQLDTELQSLLYLKKMM